MSLATQLFRRSREIGRFELPVERTLATTTAAANFERNRAALERVWSRAVLCLPDALPELEWIYARDGALSARHVDRQWFADCSVPRRAAERMFVNLFVAGPTAVMLAPTHAQQIRAVLNRLRSDQVLIAIIPGEFTAGVIAACEDFSDDISAGRLWLACGPDWADELTAIFERNEGISPASMMIRVPGLNADVVDAIQKPCEAILAKHGQSHKQRCELLMVKPRFPRTPATRGCVVTGTFELWNDAAELLEAAADGSPIECVRVNAAKPAVASILQFARAADGADVVVTANLGRIDRSNVVPTNVPWVTWATTRVPSFEPTAAGDLLVIADEAFRATATNAGWPSSRIRVAAEPREPVAIVPSALPAIIADHTPITTPKSIHDMSSHRVIWDAVSRELTVDPLKLTTSPTAYLHGWCDRVGVTREGFPVATVLESLIAPLFIRELAIHLQRRGVKFALWGRGWDAIDALREAWRGPITDHTTWTNALAASSAIYDVWPTSVAHPARRGGRAVIPTAGASWSGLVQRSKERFSTLATSPAPAFSFAQISAWLSDAA